MASSPAQDTYAARPANATRWWVVFLLFVAILNNYLDRGALSVAAVPIMGEFEIGPARMGALLSAFFWTYTLLQIPAGWVVDRYGLKWTYAGGYLLWSLASAAVGLSTSIRHIFALRLLLGVGESIAPPASLAYIRQAFRREEQGLPTAVYLAGMMLGPAFGAALGGLLLDRIGWRLLFVCAGLGGCVWLFPWLLWAPSGARGERAAVIPTAAPHPRWSRVFRSRAFWGITIGSFCYSYAWYFYLAWLPTYFVVQHGASYSQMGAATGLPLLGTAVVSVAAGRAADRLVCRSGKTINVRKAFVCTGFAIAGAGLAMLKGAASIESATLILVVALVGIGLASANYWALTQALAPGTIIGRVIGYQNTVANLAGIAAPILTGILVGGEQNFSAAILVAGASLGVASAAFLLVGERDVRLLEPDARWPELGGERPPCR